MFTDKLIIAAILAVLTSLGVGFYSGQSWANTKHEAQRAKDLDDYNRQVDLQVKENNRLADKMAKAEGKITIKTVEVIKYVPQVTTGGPCLSPAAVSLLQPGNGTGLRPPTSEHAPESSTSLAASDTDVAYWIAEANQHYDICAERLNTLIDYELEAE